jgi:CheY-like chemotaxis protein
MCPRGGEGENDEKLKITLKPWSPPADIRFVAKVHPAPPENPGIGSKARIGMRQPRVPGRRRSAILMVGEETDVLRRYADSFAAYGYTVDLASDGETAARLVSGKEFDVVVSDIDGGESSACASLRDLRAQQRRVPMIVLAGGLAFSSARAAVDCGAYKYLLKPVSDERLLEVLVEAIGDVTSRA